MNLLIYLDNYISNKVIYEYFDIITSDNYRGRDWN
jgi:hypothetical protein